MRNILSVIIFSLIVSSCSKDHQFNNLKTQVLGKWEIEEYVCGLCITPVTMYPAGNGNIIVLFNDGSFERRMHDSVTFRGKFFLSKSEECGKPDSDIAFSTNESLNSTPRFIKIEAEKLHLNIPYCYSDGALTIYRRIQ